MQGKVALHFRFSPPSILFFPFLPCAAPDSKMQDAIPALRQRLLQDFPADFVQSAAVSANPASTVPSWPSNAQFNNNATTSLSTTATTPTISSAQLDHVFTQYTTDEEGRSFWTRHHQLVCDRMPWHQFEQLLQEHIRNRLSQVALPPPSSSSVFTKSRSLQQQDLYMLAQRLSHDSFDWSPSEPNRVNANFAVSITAFCKCWPWLSAFLRTVARIGPLWMLHSQSGPIVHGFISRIDAASILTVCALLTLPLSSLLVFSGTISRIFPVAVL